MLSAIRAKALLVLSSRLGIRSILESTLVCTVSNSLENITDRLRSVYDETVKKIRLRTSQSDSKIFREVNALSRLSHRFIVRYYTTWVELSEPESTAASSDASETDGTDRDTDELDTDEADTEEADGMTSVPHSSPHSSRSCSTEDLNGSGFNGRFNIDLGDLDTKEHSGTQSSFPSIHFGGSVSSQDTDDSDDSDDPFNDLFSKEDTTHISFKRQKPKALARTLYIQMASLSAFDVRKIKSTPLQEFVERQTLKEVITNLSQLNISRLTVTREWPKAFPKMKAGDCFNKFWMHLSTCQALE